MLKDYFTWLRDKTCVRQVTDEWAEISTPHLDRHNDYIHLYVRKRNGGYALTDGGFTLTDLRQSGCSLDTPKRRELLRLTLNGFGVREDDEQLTVDATRDNFPLKKHNLIQAVLAVNDLFYLAQPNVASLFHEDVVAWLDAKDVRYTPKVKFTGKSGYDHMFDFVIPKSRRAPERVVQTINRPSRETAEGVVLAWFDTREVRPSDAQAYAFLNNREQAIPQGVLDALRSYAVIPVPWTDRDSVADQLAA